MLIKVTIENFKSFNAQSELNMIPSGSVKKLSQHKLRLKNAKVLRYAVIYGANAAGKSNLLEAVTLICGALKKGLTFAFSESYCKASKDNESKPSLFEISFEVGGRAFAYGFKAVLKERKVVGEWLYELMAEGAKALFEREEDFIHLEKGKLDAPLQSDRLLLPLLANNGTEKKCSECYKYLTENIVIGGNDETFKYRIFYGGDMLNRINRFIGAFDLGMTGAYAVPIESEMLSEKLSHSLFNQLVQEITERKLKGEAPSISVRTQKGFFNMSLNDGLECSTLMFSHGESQCFTFEEESLGTRRVFELIDMLLGGGSNIYFVDELGRSLHPKLTEKFIKLFNEAHDNDNSQLVFTTHEPSIMDEGLFRRDEIWFVERDAKNTTTLYSLDSFDERYDKRLAKAYLEGRFGALPVFSTFNIKEEK